jgi:hypothetical protein
MTPLLNPEHWVTTSHDRSLNRIALEARAAQAAQALATLAASNSRRRQAHHAAEPGIHAAIHRLAHRVACFVMSPKIEAN